MAIFALALLIVPPEVVLLWQEPSDHTCDGPERILIRKSLQ